MRNAEPLSGTELEPTAPRSAAPIRKAPKGRWRRRLMRTGYATYAVILLLIGARIALPYYLKDYVNERLNKIPDYRGSVDEIDVHLYRGAYKIIGLKLEKANGKIRTPFFKSPEIDLSVQWRELFNGALVGEIDLEQPELNFVYTESKATSQTTIDKRWQDRVQELFPLRINRFTANNGTIHFRRPDGKPPVDIRVTDVDIVTTNLTNSLEISRSLSATMDATGKAQDQAPVKLHVVLDPYAQTPTFDLDGELTNLDLPRLNRFFRDWGSFDVEKGRASFYSELVSSEKGFRGYVKPVLKDVHIVSLKKDSDNPFMLIWEGLVAGVVELFTNQRRDQFAAMIPFEGTFKNPEARTWPALFSIVGNAFVEALRPSLENSIGAGAGRKKAEEKKESERD